MLCVTFSIVDKNNARIDFFLFSNEFEVIQIEPIHRITHFFNEKGAMSLVDKHSLMECGGKKATKSHVNCKLFKVLF